MPKKRARTLPVIGKTSPELGIAVGVVLLLGVLFAYDFATNPAGTKEKVSEVTGSVVADVKEAVQAEPEPEPQPQDLITTVKIISPEKGSTQTTPFTVKAEVPAKAKICYYLVKDNGQVKWDRRTPNCNGIVNVEPQWCATKGQNTCYVLYSATGENDAALGTDSAYYSIE